jgi:hypothetical protein
MLLSNQMFDRIVGISSSHAKDPQQKATVLPAGCRKVPERRVAARMAYGHRTQICRDSGEKAGEWDTVMLQDISNKGIGFLCDDPMQPGNTFVLKLTDKEGETIRIRCKVHRCEQGGFGNTAYLVGATFEQVIQRQVLRVNDDEPDEQLWQTDPLPAAETEAVEHSGEPSGLKTAGAAMARAAVSLLRAVDPRRAALPWARRSDDFSSVG